MSKLLQGIWSSKSRREVHERNQAYRAPAIEPATPADVHKPQPGPDGTIRCCGNRYSPAAHLLHTRAERIATACGEVRVSGLDDPWISEQDARLKAARSETPTDDEAIKRAEQVAAHYDRQRKREPRKVSGASDWMAD